MRVYVLWSSGLALVLLPSVSKCVVPEGLKVY